MWAFKSVVMTIGLGISAQCWAQDGAIEAHNALDRVGAGSVAPQPYGWKLDTHATSTSVDVNGDEIPLLLSSFFPNGVALGATAAGWKYRRHGAARDDGPQLHIYPAGMLAVQGKRPAPEDVDAVRAMALSTLPDTPDLFLPRLGDIGDCPNPDGLRGVYFYATQLEPEGQRPAEVKMIITWYRVLPADDCAAEPNTFQMVVTALPGAADGLRPPARVEYRYGDCGWSVPDQPQVPDLDPAVIEDLHGARSGLLFNSAEPVGSETLRAIEVLGAREQAFAVAEPGTINEGALNVSRPNGASGNPLRFKDYCNSTNMAGDGNHGRFVFELDTSGLISKEVDGDGDGVPDGEGGHDNCPTVANPYQGDADDDLRGDACDNNADGDNYLNAEELCDLTAPNFWNADLAHDGDFDMDGLGDACDGDADNDGVPTFTDNCPVAVNPRQLDFDDDGFGSVCDHTEDAVYAHLLALLARVSGSGWEPPAVLNFMHEMPGDGKGLSGSALPLVEWWMAETGKSRAEVWTQIQALLAVKLDTTEAQSLRTAVRDAATDRQDDLWLLYSWSKTGLDLGNFLDKHGKALWETD